MPVHYAKAGPLLVMAVDGDFTLGELEKVVVAASQDGGVPPGARVLLDLSGAASLAHKTDGELARCAALFAASPGRFGRVAILVAGHLVDDLMRMGTAFMAQEGIRATPFRSRSEAESWLLARD